MIVRRILVNEHFPFQMRFNAGHFRTYEIEAFGRTRNGVNTTSMHKIVTTEEGGKFFLRMIN